MIHIIIMIIFCIIGAFILPVISHIKAVRKLNNLEMDLIKKFPNAEKIVLEKHIIPNCMKLLGNGAIVNKDKLFEQTQNAGGEKALNKVLEIMEAYK